MLPASEPAVTLGEPASPVAIYGSDRETVAEILFRTEVIEEDAVSTPAVMPPQPVEAAKASPKASEPAARTPENRLSPASSKPSFWKFGK